MKIYLLSQTDNNNYDTYDSFVVQAKTMESASDLVNARTGHFRDGEVSTYSPWSSNVNVELIGETNSETEKIILGSYNAG